MSEHTATTTANRIYQLLADEIIRGLRPSGQKLEEQILADEFEVSRTPVREALRDLAARGLVEGQPRRGFVVARIGPDEVAQLLDAECEMEGLCARLSALRMGAIEKSELRQIHEQSEAVVRGGDLVGYWQLNTLFHEAICNGVRNRAMARMVSQLRERLSAYRRAQDDDADRFTRSLAEHAAILDAILASDADRAYEAMRQHNARLSVNVLRRMRLAVAREAGGTAGETAASATAARDAQQPEQAGTLLPV
ncbi:GntR family transcriptional regulator [Roseomonas sp. NAR14]|uniref:GntR family transcriptional regulator n=1 Tax=Roseomonas acroporae TaxID=2937791 RepID=A0A9X1YDH7_9PROT|nr:GntR family transcriptional regulator [Roseomonas acroporae]MCK8787765.1 GntR family transcriptional regulator [Roseomonas acroporae]